MIRRKRLIIRDTKLLSHASADAVEPTVHRRVRRVDTNSVPNGFFCHSFLKSESLNGAQGLEKQGVVCEDEVAVRLDSFVYNSLGNVRAAKNGRYVSIVVTNLQSRIVPFRLGGQGGYRFDNIDNIFKKQLPVCPLFLLL